MIELREKELRGVYDLCMKRGKCDGCALTHPLADGPNNCLETHNRMGNKFPYDFNTFAEFHRAYGQAVLLSKLDQI